MEEEEKEEERITQESLERNERLHWIDRKDFKSGEGGRYLGMKLHISYSRQVFRDIALSLLSAATGDDIVNKPYVC